MATKRNRKAKKPTKQHPLFVALEPIAAALAGYMAVKESQEAQRLLMTMLTKKTRKARRHK